MEQRIDELKAELEDVTRSKQRLELENGRLQSERDRGEETSRRREEDAKAANEKSADFEAVSERMQASASERFEWLVRVSCDWEGRH